MTSVLFLASLVSWAAEPVAFEAVSCEPDAELDVVALESQACEGVGFEMAALEPLSCEPEKGSDEAAFNPQPRKPEPATTLAARPSEPAAAPAQEAAGAPSDSIAAAEGESSEASSGEPNASPTLLAPTAMSAPTLPAGLVLAPMEAPEPVVPAVIEGGPRESNRIALTFDACATSRSPGQLDEKVLAVLVENNVPATIFVGGKWMTNQPDATRMLAATPGIELANHSFWHPHMTHVPPTRVREEIEWTERVLFSLTGRRSRFFRPPFGEYDEKLVKLVAEQGITTVAWTLAGGDSGSQATKDRLVHWILEHVGGGSLVLLHINGRGRHTAEALTEIIPALRARGFVLTTVSDLIAPLPLASEEPGAASTAQPMAMQAACIGAPESAPAFATQASGVVSATTTADASKR